ncbi:MAG: elongation factor P [Holosporales bacterium]|jgi:elongation factor P|nr:elongation factor P [Holosporales bacterium]
MKIDGNAIKIGMLLEHKGKLWSVVKTQHVKPGKGGAYMQVELKDIRSGSKLNERFRAGESVERVHLEEEEFQFLYKEGDGFVFMNNTNFEQISLSADQVGDGAVYLKENMTVSISFYEKEVIGVVLPDTVVMEIAETEPVVKGQTAASSYKPAVLDNGVRIMVPPHIEAGIKVVVNTADNSYVERAK